MNKIRRWRSPTHQETLRYDKNLSLRGLLISVAWERTSNLAAKNLDLNPSFSISICVILTSYSISLGLRYLKCKIRILPLLHMAILKAK